MRLFLLTAFAAAAWLVADAPSQARTFASAMTLRPKAIVQPSGLQQGAAGAGANLVFFGGRGAQFNWAGKGAQSQNIPVCISTASGRFRLTISSTSGGAASKAATIPYTVHFTDGAGGEQVATTEHSPNISFDGAAPAGAHSHARTKRNGNHYTG